MAETCKQLLLVGPDSPERERAVGALVDCGYRVRVASSWLGALVRGAAHARSLDLLLVDRLLPGIGGFELARHMRRLLPALPVVLTELDGRCQLLEEVDALLAPLGEGRALGRVSRFS